MVNINKIVRTCFILIILSPSLAFAEQIGKVVLTQGNPIVERNNHHIFIKRNDLLFTGDTLITPLGTKILFRLNDESTISLAENTEFVLSRYRYKRKSSDVSFKMLKGAFRALSGRIGKQKNPQFEVNTPIATIGIRGTEFWGGMIFSNALDVTMLSGKGIYIKNKYGKVNINQSGLGTEVQPGKAPSKPKLWSQEKLAKAAAATSLTTNTPPSNSEPLSQPKPLPQGYVDDNFNNYMDAK